MNIKKIEEVIRLMEKHNLTEISIEEEGAKIHLRKGMNGRIEEAGGPWHIPSSASMPAAPTGGGLLPNEEEKNVVEIKTPMVGTFYSAPSPDANPFVEVGSKINTGDILCIVEAMKLMNEIKSEVKGKITDILVENGDPIEFGQALFLVEPA